MSSTEHKGDFWGGSNEVYEKIMANGPPRTSVQSVVNSLNAIVPYKNADAILDAGCGTAFATRYLIEEYGDQIQEITRLLAADLSPGMIESVKSMKREYSNNKLWQRLETQVSSIENMPLIEDNSVSHIIASLVMFFPEHPAKAFNESYRILKPGGIIGISSFKSTDWLALLDIAHEIVPEISFAAGKSPHWSSREAIKNNLCAAGFCDVEIHEVDNVFEMSNVRSYLEFLLTPRNTQVAELFRKSPEKKEEAIQHVMNYTNDKYGKNKAPKLVNTLYITTAKK